MNFIFCQHNEETFLTNVSAESQNVDTECILEKRSLTFPISTQYNINIHLLQLKHDNSFPD